VRLRDSSVSLIELLTNKPVMLLFCAMWLSPIVFKSDAVFSPLFEVRGLGGSSNAELSSDLPDLELGETEAPKDIPLSYSVYRVRSGDNIQKIADRFQLSIDSVISFNDIQSTRKIHQGQYLKIPNQNGLMEVATSGDTVDSLAKKYSIIAERIVSVNKLGQTGGLHAGDKVFLPDAFMDKFRLREINGELFRWPVWGFNLTCYYGYRSDPFTHERSFHNGLDLAMPYGSPVRAAMEGVVASTGYNSTYGNYILINHHSGYRTLYGHLSAVRVQAGESVNLGQIVGNVGSTGRSTGPHLHFTVFRWNSAIDPLPLVH
jgi:murein DD-endopeptidase MepM/ murein hydrolase activator NlpD